MSDFTTYDFKIGMSLMVGKCRAEILSIEHPYAMVKLPGLSKEGLGKYPQRKINLLAYKEADSIDVESLQSDEALERAELADLLD